MRSPARWRRLLCTASMLSLFPACGRDVALPDPPPEPEVRAPVPELLGDLSGTYGVSLGLPWLDAETAGLRAPLPTELTVLHLPDPAGEPRGALFVVASRGEEERVRYVGVAEGDEIRIHPRASPDQVIRGTRAPGGGAFALDVDQPICRGGEPKKWLVQRTCSFDESISGIYEGSRSAGTCEPNGGTPAVLALGFREPRVIGLEWPVGGLGRVVEDSTLFEGRFRRVDGLGVLRVASASPELEMSALELTEQGGVLTATLEQRDAICTTSEQCPSGSCVAGFCETFRELPCTSVVSATRLVAPVSEACDPQAQARLQTEAVVVEAGNQRFLEVRIRDRLLETEAAAEAVQAKVYAVGGRAAELPPLRPESVLRFLLPQEADGRSYEVWSWVRGAGTPTMAIPTCFVDARR